MANFNPPARTLVPVITDNTPEFQKRPFAYFTPSIPKGNNVWVDTNNKVSEQQPPLWVAQTFHNADGSIASSSPGVKAVYYGGHSYTISASEVQILTNAGYGAYIS